MIRLIKNNEDYADAMARINALFDLEPAPSTPESDELEVLSVLISDYEERNGLKFTGHGYESAGG